MTNLYEIGNEINDLMNRRQEDQESGEPTESVNFEGEMGRLQGAFNDKIENICKYMKNLESDNAGLDLEIKRLSERKQSNSKKIDRLKSYIAMVLQSQGIDKLELSLFKLSFRMSSSLDIVDEKIVPEQFKEKIVTETIKIDKNQIKAFIKTLGEGQSVPGVQLNETKNLQIK